MVSHFADLLDSRYELKESIGTGGMGTIFRARDLLSGTDVALKQVTVPNQKIRFASLSGSKDVRLALAQEFRFLATLRHPHIISVLDYGFDEQQQPYYTMDLLKRPSTIVDYALDLELKQRVELLVQMGEALAYLHRRGILHRDLKPENVLVTDGHVRVVDFGLAVQSGRDDEDEDILAGTLGYMAPEIMVGEPPSESSDLYAFGVIAYEALVGRHPFGLDDLTQLAMDLMYIDPDFDLPDMDPEMIRILGKLMAKEPSERYDDARDVIRDITEVVGLPQVEDELIRDSYIKAARFVGREREFQQLNRALDATLEDEPQGSAWLIGGESGVGKSRLVDELRAVALVKGALVLVGQATNNGVPFQLWRGVLRRLVLTTPLPVDTLAVLQEIIPNLQDLLDRYIPEAPPIDERAAVLRRLARALVDVFKRQTRPMVMIMEDLHWGEESLDLLDALLAELDSLPLLVIGTYRNEETPHLPSRLPSMGSIILQRLTDREILDLSVSIMGEDVGRRRNVLNLLKQETEGNVFFLVEVVRVLAEEAGNLDNIGSVTLPESVFSGSIATVIERRLKRLPLDAHPMLRIAAVYGREIDLAVMREIDAKMDYENWLVTCTNAAILEAQGDSWRFAHDRMRDGILDMLPRDELEKLNLLVAESIETVYPDDSAYASRLMEHWTVAGYPEKEAHYAFVAGRQSFAVNDYQEALELFLRSASILRDDTPAELFIDQGDIHYQLGNFKPARASLKTAMKRDMPDEERIRLLTIMGDIAMEKGTYYRAERMLEEAYRLGRRGAAKPVTLSRVMGSMAETQLKIGKTEDANELLLKANDIAKDTRDANRTLHLVNLMAEVAMAEGDLRTSANLLTRAYRIARSTKNNEREMAITNSLGKVALEQGKLDQAQQWFLRSIETAYQLGSMHYLPIYVNNLARVRIAMGELETARHDLHEALERSLELDLIPGVLLVLVSYGGLFEAEGNRARALRIFGVVKSHLAYTLEMEKQIEGYLALWGATIEDAERAGRGHSFEREVSLLLGRPWQAEQFGI